MNHSRAIKAWESLSGALGVPLKPIESDKEHRAMIGLMENLISRMDDIDHHPLSPLLHLVGTYIKDWEDKTEPVAEAPPHRVLALLMEQQGLKAADLADLEDPGNLSRILNGKRQISKALAKKLAERFRVSATAFL